MKINTKQFQNLKIADINSSNELRPFDFRPHTQVSSRKQTENELRSSRSIKDNNDNGTFSSLEFPQDSFSGSLIKALFRQNNIKSVRNSLIEQTVGLKRKTSDSPILNFKNYKFPNMPEGVGNKKEFEVYLNMKNYKLSKNILNWLKKVCETTLKERPKTSDHAYVDQKIMDIYTTLLHHLSNIPSMINECVNNRDNREDLFSSISLMAAELMQTKDFGLYVESLKLQAKIFKIYGDFSKSLQTYTQAMQLCNKHNLYKLKTKVYKRLGKLYLELQNLPKAKSNFIKSLQMAWFVSSQKYELLAYDLLGLIAYYEGSIEKAKYYHNRMITCELEDINSAIRLVAISKIKNKIEMRRSMENNFMLDANVVSSDEEEEGLYEVKKKKEDFEIYLTKSKIKSEYLFHFFFLI
jgi:tetratricopeptide (TPR) repeat protein